MILGWQKSLSFCQHFLPTIFISLFVNKKTLSKKFKILPLPNFTIAAKFVFFARLFYTMHMRKSSSFCIVLFTEPEIENFFARAETVRLLINPQVKQPCRIV
jgi:hypothetical protein